MLWDVNFNMSKILFPILDDCCCLFSDFYIVFSVMMGFQWSFMSYMSCIFFIDGVFLFSSVIFIGAMAIKTKENCLISSHHLAGL